MVALRLCARAALILHLLCVHVALFRLWYASGLRKLFTRLENEHVQDLHLAIRLAEGVDVLTPSARPLPKGTHGGRGRLALLFMLRSRLEELETWRGWLAPEAHRPEPRLSLYFHLADGASEEAAAALMALPGARRVVPTVATGWCELMAAEVALIQAALSDDLGAEVFVFLPHDAVPLMPMGNVLGALLAIGSAATPPTRICPAGVRGLELPSACPHAIEPHWSRSLLLKHHQWMALSRPHATRLVDSRALRAASAIFGEWFLGEPLCSDEVLPLLALAVPESELSAFDQRGSAGNAASPFAAPKGFELSRLPLYVAATGGLDAFEEGLRALGVDAACLTYAPWPGCHSGAGLDKLAISPLVGGGMSLVEREDLMRKLAGKGILFVRKLGIFGGNSSAHLNFIRRLAPLSLILSKAPPRLLPEPDALDFNMRSCLVWLRWGLSTMEAIAPVHVQVVTAAVLGFVSGWLAVRGGGIGIGTHRKLLAAYVVGHCVVFFFSIVACRGYSLLEPLRKAGILTSEEL